MKRGLILMEVANAEEIEIQTDEINRRVDATLQEAAAYYSEEEVRRLSSGQNLANLRNRIATDEIITRTMKKLRDIAMGIIEEKDDTAEPEETENEAAETHASTEVETETAESVDKAADVSESEEGPSESAEDVTEPADEHEDA
jgi:hypothetical protein